MVSVMEEVVVNLNFLNTRQANNPKKRPIKLDTTNVSMNFPLNQNNVDTLNSFLLSLQGLNIEFTVWNNTKTTASLITPYPMTIENRFGYSSNFSTDSPTSTSDELSRELKSIDSVLLISTSCI
jgi:hypothetical protein